jgi:hypothetical protein
VRFLEFSQADPLAAIEHDDTRQHATTQFLLRDPMYKEPVTVGGELG